MSGRRVLFSAQKNEGPFILEWVAYHKVIGFTDIVVVSNDCDDGSDDLLDALADAGEVQHIRQTVTASESAQLSAAQVACRAGVFHDDDWVMWLDLDEFLLPSPPRQSVQDIISDISNADALFVPWRMFGDSGNSSWPGRHVSHAFTRAARRWRGRDSQGKTLFKINRFIDRIDIHRPILNAGVSSDDYKIMTASRDPAPERFYRRDTRNTHLRLQDAKRPYALAQVAHFSVRTRDMFDKKNLRGDGYFASDKKVVPRNDRMFRNRNFNEVQELGLASFENKTSEEMQRLLGQQDLRKKAEQIEGFRASPSCGAVPVHYWDRRKNFGDAIGPMVVNSVLGKPVRKPNTLDNERLFSVGSILHLITEPGTVVWGTGLLGPINRQLQRRFETLPAPNILAVRGHLTRKEIQTKLNWNCPEVYGDPALLLPTFLKIEEKSDELVVCPHWKHKSAFRHLSDVSGLKVVDVANDPKLVIAQLASAKAVIASSLHGLIVAQAYGVPWIWMREKDAALDGSDFKFLDFFSTLQYPDVPSFSFTNGTVTVEQMLKVASRARKQVLAIDLAALRDSLASIGLPFINQDL